MPRRSFVATLELLPPLLRSGLCDPYEVILNLENSMAPISVLHAAHPILQQSNISVKAGGFNLVMDNKISKLLKFVAHPGEQLLLDFRRHLMVC